MLRGLMNHGMRSKIRTGAIVGGSVRLKLFHHISVLQQQQQEGKQQQKLREKDQGGQQNTTKYEQKQVDGEVKNEKETKKETEEEKKKNPPEKPTEDGDSVLDVPIPVELGRKIDDELIKNYVDTMHIFNQLKKLGLSNGQSDLILQLINENLTFQLNKMNGKFTTAMEMENESYLFEAAQSELRIEINTSRELDLHTLENEKNSSDLLLREESEELNKFMIVSTNDTQVLINDQNSENTLLQKGIKMKIKDLDNKISTNINSDIKSDIESLRWQTTRSGLFAILVLVFSIIGGVSISKRINKEEQPTEVILHTIKPEESIEEDEHEEEEGEHQKLLK